MVKHTNLKYLSIERLEAIRDESYRSSCGQIEYCKETIDNELNRKYTERDEREALQLIKENEEMEAFNESTEQEVPTLTFNELIDMNRDKATFKFDNEEIVNMIADIYGDLDVHELNEYEVMNDIDYDGSFHELIDSRIEIYNYELRKWAVDNWQYIEEAVDTGLVSDLSDYHSAIMSGQYVYWSEVYNEKLSDIIELINKLVEKWSNSCH